MKKTPFAFVVIFLTVSIYSCSKDDSPTPASAASLIGSYKFVSLSAKTNTTFLYTESGVAYKGVSLADYTSINNKGTVTLTSNQFTTNGMGYDIDDDFTYYGYENGVFTDSIVFPFQFSMPPTNSTTGYTLVGADSITFANGGIFSNSDIDQVQGGKLVLNGNDLAITFRVGKDSSYVEEGTLINQKQSATGVMRFQKQ